MATRELYLLKAKDSFEFQEEKLPKGPLTVVSCWGVRYKENPPLDPWHLICKDGKGQIHCLVLPARTPVKR